MLLLRLSVYLALIDGAEERNLFEQILVRQAGRLAGQASVNREDLTRITAADVEAVGRANDLEAKER